MQLVYKNIHSEYSTPSNSRQLALVIFTGEKTSRKAQKGAKMIFTGNINSRKAHQPHFKKNAPRGGSVQCDMRIQVSP